MRKVQHSETNSFLRVERMIRAILPRSVKVETDKGDNRADLLIDSKPIKTKWIGEGTLADARRVLALRRRQRPDIVLARRLSPGARYLLSKSNIGWADETGAVEIHMDTIIISRDGVPLKTAERPAKWTPAVIAVAEALLCDTKATISAAQETTGLSTGSCTHALRVLTQLELLTAGAKRGPQSGRQIADLDRFLAAYTAAVEAQPTPVSLQVGAIERDLLTGIITTGKKWRKARIAWAATGVAAAAVLAPYLTSVTTAEVYIDADSFVELEAIAANAGLRPIEGGRLTLRPFPTVTVRQLSQAVNGLQVAPWPRVYADLCATGVRGEEAAEHLREVINAN